MGHLQDTVLVQHLVTCRAALHCTPSCRSLLARRQLLDEVVMRRPTSCCMLLGPSVRQVCGLAVARAQWDNCAGPGGPCVAPGSDHKSCFKRVRGEVAVDMGMRVESYDAA